MKLAIHQPNFFPWLGFFHRMSLVDTFVFLDHVQMPRMRGLATRGRIRLGTRPFWLTVPILKKGRGFQPFCDVEINFQHVWRRKHVRTLTQVYGKTEFFKEYAEDLFAIYEAAPTNLADFNVALIAFIADRFGIKSQFIRSSELGVPGERTTQIVNICKKLNCSVYVSGEGFAMNFLDVKKFEDEGIHLEFQNFRHPIYTQTGPGFLSGMSALDLLFNHGPKSLSVLSHPEESYSEKEMHPLEFEIPEMGLSIPEKVVRLRDEVAMTGHRKRYLEAARDYMGERLGWEADRLNALEARALSPGCPWIEFGHAPQIPHMGIVRMFCVANLEAAERGGVVCFALNDHVGVKELRETRFLSLYCRGVLVRDPPRYGFPKSRSRLPMNRLPPPEEGALRRFVDKWVAVARLNRSKDEDLFERISGIGDFLMREARQSRTAADWFTRVFLKLLNEFESSLDRVLVMPTSRFSEVFAPEVTEFRKRIADLGVEPVPLWIWCGFCGHRIRRDHDARDDELRFCGKCGEKMTPRPMPDVVARQVISGMLTEFSLRVTGGRKEYADRVDRLTEQIYDQESILRREVAGATVVYNAGAPPQGNNRCSLLQFVAEFPEVRLLERVQSLSDAEALEFSE